MIELPAELMQYIGDSEIEVHSWASEDDKMVLDVSKDIGSETGRLTLTGIDLVKMRPKFTVATISVHDEAFSDCPDLELDADQIAIVFQESWGAVYYVVAEGLHYEKNG